MLVPRTTAYSRSCRIMTTSACARICRWSFLTTEEASTRRRGPIEHVYFPIDGVASLVITTSDGHGAEVGTIGSEGLWDCRSVSATTKRPHRLTSRFPAGAVHGSSPFPRRT